MAGPSATITKGNILAGPGALYVADDVSTVVYPADAAVNIAPAASGGWRDCGATSGGVKATVNLSYFNMTVDQVPDHVGRRLTERVAVAATSLAEATLTNYRTALNESYAASGSGAGYTKQGVTPGQPSIFVGERAVILDGYAPGTNKRRRILIRRCTTTANVEMAYVKDGITLIPVEFSSLFVDSSTSPFDVIDEA
jgi:hypothetical protein